MNRQLTGFGLRFARRHPRRALGIGLSGSSLYLKQRKGQRHPLRFVQPVRRVATDQKVHAEARQATMEALRAARRVHRVGAASALTDRRVARYLRHSTGHASRAASLAVHPPRHRVRKTAIAVAGAGVLAGAVYGGRRKYSTRSADWTAPAADDTTAAG